MRRSAAPIAAALALAALLAAAVPARAEPAATAPLTLAPAATHPAATAPRSPTVPRDRLGALFRSVGPAWDPARRGDFAFTPEPTAAAMHALVAFHGVERAAEAVGDRATALAAAMLVGHLLRIHDEPAARPILERAVAAAEAARWRDAAMRTALHDLATIRAAAGDAAAAAALEKRAAACPRPCADDRPTRLFADGRRAAATLPEAVRTEAPLADRLAAYRLGRPFLRDTLGQASPWMMVFATTWQDVFEETRPFTAVEIRRDLLLGLTDPAARATALDDMTRLLRRAGEYREAAETAREAAGLWRGLGRPAEALDADYAEAMARRRGGDPAARARIADLAGPLGERRAAAGDVVALRELAGDLVALRLGREAEPVLAALWNASKGLWGVGQFLRASAAVGRARLAAAAGRFDEAAGFLDEAAAAAPKADDDDGAALYALALDAERAALDATRGNTAAATRRRAAVETALAAVDRDRPVETMLSVMADLRDLGGIDGAGVLAEVVAAGVDRGEERPSYQTAQHLWQVAYALALSGRTGAAFERMKAAAAIAVRHSFETVDDTDGGSLQLLRRDRWRYLLFVDIAWAAAKNRPPSEMTVPSRY